MNFPKFFRKIGRLLLEVITIGLIGFIVFIFLISMWENEYLNRYKYVQGQDIKQEILDSKLDPTMERREKWARVIQKGGTGVIDSTIIGALKLFGVGKNKSIAKRQFSHITLEIETDSLIKLKEKAKEKGIGVEKYINDVFKDYVKE